MRTPNVGRRWFAVFSVFLILAPATQAAFPERLVVPMKALAFEDQPVILTGAALPAMLGQNIQNLALFRYEPNRGFVPIPFQIDERLDKVFNPGSPQLEFTENIYDIDHEEDGLLDADDEVALLFRDAGIKAPALEPWPAGAEPIRIEVQVVDSRPIGHAPPRWVYLFSGPGLSRSSTRYVRWVPGPTGTITTDLFQLQFEGNWLMTGFSIFPPCGSGNDLLDRVKGRALNVPGYGEDEEHWNEKSSYLGGISGPIRAIRYVRGAMSGVNTMHHDIVYRSLWVRRLNLRVHALPQVQFYFDWLSQTGLQFYTPADPKGVRIDGQPDQIAQSTVPAWTVTGGSAGGLGITWELRPSPLYREAGFLYRDDRSYNDQLRNHPEYHDEDDSAYGLQGIVVKDLIDSTQSVIPFSFKAYPLCANTSWVDVGPEIQDLLSFPLAAQPTVEFLGGPVRDLKLTLSSSDLELRWNLIPGIVKFRAYAATSPTLPNLTWTPLGETQTDHFWLSGGAVSSATSFYSVSAIRADNTELW